MKRERAIRKLREEIDYIQAVFFSKAPKDDERTALYRLQLQRDHLIRGMILDLHLSFDDLLSRALRDHFLGKRSLKSKARTELDVLFYGSRAIRFNQKLAMAKGLNWISIEELKEWERLNTVRNNCGHVWLLGRSVVRRMPKKPVLRYKGKNIHETEAFLEFVHHFARLYRKFSDCIVTDD